MTAKIDQTPRHALLSINGLEFSYGPRAQAGTWTLRVPRFDVESNEVHIISGNNMSGKSTFINIVGGLQSADNARIRIRGQEVKSASEIQKSVITLSNSDNMFPEFSIWDNIRIALPRNGKKTYARQREECSNFLTASEIFSGKSLDDPLDSVSTGGRALVKLCRAHVSGAALVVIDELTSYLDDERASFFLNRVLSLLDTGTSVLIVSHNERDRLYIRRNAKLQNKVCHTSL